MVIFYSGLQGQKKHFVHYKNIKVQESCEGAAVKSNLNASVFHLNTSIRLTNLGSDINDYKLLYLDEEIKKDSSFYIYEEEDLNNIFVEFILEENIENRNIYLNQKNEKFERNDTINIYTGYYSISTKTKEVTISESCLDRVYLIMPIIATQTDLKFFKFENGEYNEPELRTYYSGMGGNIIGIPRTAVGKYKIGLTGCYSPYKEYEIVLK